ncbi:hypothetical protein [Photobacterium chitinilyticum]|uniref:Uncharacterized protein n=1 Tax=Photobacterium chitinilyticum TaxID=2485123 RepID=A0A3S3QRK8_9GAMM|nr:hypothetical protein [Photobacterium chitinilyticum]RWX57122.1 hypothetical protein EDI28_03550 [Photobacterium chitinilyticum]
MTFSKKQLARAYDVLIQGVVCLDDNLRQGVLVYIESLLLEQGIQRDKYLSLEDLHSHYPYVCMGSYMPIDFFNADNLGLITACNDENFKPISLKVCTVLQGGHKPVHRWHTVGTYRCDDIISAIHVLLETLSNGAYFNPCKTCNTIRPAGYLDDEQVCGCCHDGLLGVA